VETLTHLCYIYDMKNSLENILITKKSTDYELLDSGDGQKLERYATGADSVVLSRPELQALWSKSLSETEWQKADAVFTRTGTTGKWQVTKTIPEPWTITLDGVTLSLKLLPSKHLGVFPEQSEQWKWLAEKIKNSTKQVSVLNLFGYTGGASIACAKAGAIVTHVDSSEFAVDLANTNAKLSDVENIRFIVDDVRKFVEREVKRGNRYDIILLDPPVYGKGNTEKKQRQIWKIEEDLLPLLTRIKSILSAEPVAIVLNGYASGYSHITYGQVLKIVTGDLGGTVSSGELAIEQSNSEQLLPSGIFARFEK
jgi:23S rRNA (cytosine1962-C5)-methyltransferase